MFDMTVTGTISYEPRMTKDDYATFLLKLEDSDNRWVKYVTVFDRTRNADYYKASYESKSLVKVMGRPGITVSRKGDNTYHNLSCTIE